MTSADVRAHLTDALRLDLIGPDAGSPLAAEVLPQSPARWYLTGFLVPTDAPEAQRHDATASEEVGQSGDSGTGDDSISPEAPAARRALFHRHSASAC